jgi:hypothetical protein
LSEKPGASRPGFITPIHSADVSGAFCSFGFVACIFDAAAAVVALLASFRSALFFAISFPITEV